MNFLVTAGNTQVPIDRVRCLTNVFTGRTGAAIARRAHERGHAVTLLTSHPDTVADLSLGDRWAVIAYSTFDELASAMGRHLRGGAVDALVHCAAVSDYLCAGVYAPAPGTQFQPEPARWVGEAPALVDRLAGKVKSDEPELWLRLIRAPKIVDHVRGDWGFRGVLVKFKLEVGISDDQLLEIAEASRRHSRADLMAANTLEGAASHAYFGPLRGTYEKIARADLPDRLVQAVEALHTAGKGG